MGAGTGPPPPDTHYGGMYLGVIGVFTALSIGACAARIYTRVRPKVNLRLDDYLMVFSTILCTANYPISIAGVVQGWGHHSAYISVDRQVRTFKGLFAQEVLWIFAIASIRISIAWSLLRLSRARAWRWTLWIIIVVQIITYLGHLLFQFFNCRPLRANWEAVYDIRCWPRKYVLYYGWTSNGILVTIDFILALMPIQLIRTLNRSTREKILISCLMALGLMAAAIAAYRTSISNKTFAGDLLSTTVKMSMWCMLEAQLGIIAACAATLKAPVERIVRQLGLLASRVEMTKPSFVLSLQDREPSPASDDSNPLHYTNSGGESGKEARTTKSGASTLDMERALP